MSTKQYGYKIAENGTVTVLTPTKAKLDLKELQAGVGGMIQQIGLKKSLMWVDENGLFSHGFNRKASALVRIYNRYGHEPYVVGDVVFIPYKGFDLTLLENLTIFRDLVEAIRSEK